MTIRSPGRWAGRDGDVLPEGLSVAGQQDRRFVYALDQSRGDIGLPASDLGPAAQPGGRVTVVAHGIEQASIGFWADEAGNMSGYLAAPGLMILILSNNNFLEPIVNPRLIPLLEAGKTNRSLGLKMLGKDSAESAQMVRANGIVAAILLCASAALTTTLSAAPAYAQSSDPSSKEAISEMTSPKNPRKVNVQRKMERRKQLDMRRQKYNSPRKR